ncbi:MAG TPA: PaaI family thioesterase [bacterium]|nr:PaaI family thioesterase [bacterium]
MKKLRNPHLDDNALCFACSPHNPIGLQMEFYDDGDSILAYWQPQRKYEGFENVLHGGIQSTMIDEIAAWTVFVKGGTAGVTKSINVEYKQPVYINKGKIKLKSKFHQKDERHARVNVKLFNHKNEIAAQGEAVYYLYPPKIARKKLNYPGVEAYYEKE